MDKWNVQHLSEILNAWGLWGHLVGALLAFVQTLLPFIPFVVVAGANVLIFGLWTGFAVNYVMAVLGAVTAFWFARSYGRRWAENKLMKYPSFQKINEKMAENGFLYIAVSRIIPVLPSVGINLAAAVMRVRKRDFVWGTLVGKLPMILLESFIGHDLLHFHHNKGRLILLLAIFILLFITGNYYRKKWFDIDGSK